MLKLYDKGSLQLPSTLLQRRLPVVLTQITNRTLFSQLPTGSWGEPGSIETTAYGILTLAAVSSLPWVSCVRDHIDQAIRTGQQFLTQAQQGGMFHEYLWVEKVTYGSEYLRESYRLAALKSSQRSHIWSSRISDLVLIPEKSISRLSALTSTLSMYREQQMWRLRASMIKGHTFLPMLKSRGTEILPGQENARNEYLDLIPCTWVLENNLRSLFMPASIIWDMMVLTIGNFRIDQYIENMLAKCDRDFLEMAKSITSSLCIQVQSGGALTLKPSHEDSVRPVNSGANSLETARPHHEEAASFETTVHHYIEEMLGSACVQQASIIDRKHFSNELQSFLLSQITQIEDNARFLAQD